MHPQNISILDYTYILPAEKIALHPLPQRDASKLLLYKGGKIEETIFTDITRHLPASSLLVTNNTKVINARLVFQKPSGARIEIFCLEPAGNITDYQTVMAATGNSTWNCMVGGAAKWKETFLEKAIIVGHVEVILKARLLQRTGDNFLVEFSWQPSNMSFADVIEEAGFVPLPPYIKRQADAEDASRYQTVFARQDGSVAAPTAGLHFTSTILNELSQKNIEQAQLTLHVGAGTFKPVKASLMKDHEMHAEFMEVSKSSIQQILSFIGNITAVGTTACRCMETLYWLGVKALQNEQATTLALGQWELYSTPLCNTKVSAADALQALLQWMEMHKKATLFTHTQLMIAPGYRFKLVNRLVTNFHQPQSTLLLLVAAAVGGQWKKMYDYALQHDFRFLSYGDSNLIWINT